MEVVAALLQIYPEAEGIMDSSSRVTYADKLVEAKALLASPSGIRASAAPQLARKASELVAKLKAAFMMCSSRMCPLGTPRLSARRGQLNSRLAPVHCLISLSGD